MNNDRCQNELCIYIQHILNTTRIHYLLNFLIYYNSFEAFNLRTQFEKTH